MPNSTPDRLPLIDLQAAAARLGVNDRFVRRLVAEDRITFYKVGRLLRFDPAETEAWLNRNRRGFRRPA